MQRNAKASEQKLHSVEKTYTTVLYSEPSNAPFNGGTNKKFALAWARAFRATRVQRMLFKDNTVFSTCVPTILPQVESLGNRLFNQEQGCQHQAGTGKQEEEDEGTMEQSAEAISKVYNTMVSWGEARQTCNPIAQGVLTKKDTN